MRKTFLWTFLTALVVIAVGVALFMAFIYPKLKLQAELQRLQINEVELTKVSDGTYHGEFFYYDFMYEVEVVVVDHEITQIAVLKNIDDVEYAKRTEDMVEQVVKEQSLKVDMVTGATITSKALLKAIENALSKGIQE